MRELTMKIILMFLAYLGASYLVSPLFGDVANEKYYFNLFVAVFFSLTVTFVNSRFLKFYLSKKPKNLK